MCYWLTLYAIFAFMRSIGPIRRLCQPFCMYLVLSVAGCSMYISLLKNVFEPSKYNDDLVQHGTSHYEFDAKQIRINLNQYTG